MPSENQTPNKPQTSGVKAVMPIGARRLFIIGCVCVLAGLVAGRFVFVGLVLAVAGLTALAVALSYRAEKVWFWKLSWVVGIAGALWIAVTAAYGWSISSAANASGDASASYASSLFLAGMIALGAMSCGVLAAVTTRIIRARRGAVGAPGEGSAQV